MIGLILGTSEGKRILSLLNEFTDDIFISAASSYGGEIYSEFKYKAMNARPLAYEELKEALVESDVKVLIDASHPYALEITSNAMKACKELHIEYLRYERPSCVNDYEDCGLVKVVEDYDDLKEALSEIRGTILNTTGSRNLKKLVDMKLENRMVHRVLPSVKVLNECFDLGVDVADVIAMKGPVSKELNASFIREYDARAMLMKDSGMQGGTDLKIKACIECGIPAFVMGRKKTEYEMLFNTEEEAVEYAVSKYVTKRGGGIEN